MLSKRVMLLKVIQALAHKPMMRGWTTSWLSCKTSAQNCLASQLSCTLSIPDLRQSLPLSKLNWIKSKGSYKKMMTGYSMKKGGNGNHDRGRAMIGRES